MKKTKKIVLMVTLALCAIMAFSATAFAAEKITDSDICNLTVKFQQTQLNEDPDYAKEGVTVKLYKVCSLTDLGETKVTSDFSGLTIPDGASTDSESEKILNDAIGLLTSNTNVTYQTKTDANKEAKFTNIENGIYLVYVDSFENNGKLYGISKALVMIPTETNENTWNYNLEVELKGYEILKMKYVVSVDLEKVEESDKPESINVDFSHNDFETETNITDPWTKDVMLTNDNWLISDIVPDDIPGYDYVVTISGQTITITYIAKDKPVPPQEKDVVVIEIGPKEEEEIPNTGLLWWPVTALAVAGVLFVSYGLIRRKHSNEE